MITANTNAEGENYQVDFNSGKRSFSKVEPKRLDTATER